LAIGTTLSDFRFLPALAGAGLILLTGWLTRELGGGRFPSCLLAHGFACPSLHVATASETVLVIEAFRDVVVAGEAPISNDPEHEPTCGQRRR